MPGSNPFFFPTPETARDLSYIASNTSYSEVSRVLYAATSIHFDCLDLAQADGELIVVDQEGAEWPLGKQWPFSPHATFKCPTVDTEAKVAKLIPFPAPITLVDDVVFNVDHIRENTNFHSVSKAITIAAMKSRTLIAAHKAEARIFACRGKQTVEWEPSQRLPRDRLGLSLRLETLAVA